MFEDSANSRLEELDEYFEFKVIETGYNGHDALVSLHRDDPLPKAAADEVEGVRLVEVSDGSKIVEGSVGRTATFELVGR